MLFHKVATKDASAMQTNTANGEIFYDTVSNSLKISDGTTAGGVLINTNGLQLKEVGVHQGASKHETVCHQ